MESRFSLALDSSRRTVVDFSEVAVASNERWAFVYRSAATGSRTCPLPTVIASRVMRRSSDRVDLNSATLVVSVCTCVFTNGASAAFSEDNDVASESTFSRNTPNDCANSFSFKPALANSSTIPDNGSSAVVSTVLSGPRAPELTISASDAPSARPKMSWLSLAMAFASEYLFCIPLTPV